jgi:hypothetical protein
MGKLLLNINFLISALACYSQVTQTSFSTTLRNDTVIYSTAIGKLKLVGLPCPNSSTKAGGPWSYKEAKKRKDEIFKMTLTDKYFGWTNPTTGGAIHINKKDEIEVYGFTFGIFKKMDSSGVHYIDAPKDTSVVVNSSEIWYNVSGVGFGNETSVLITSEVNLRKSKAIKRILTELWKPGTQIYYLVRQ